MNIRGLLLCGGRSSRYGSDKLLATLPDGVPLGVRSAANLIAGVGNAIAIVPRGARELRERLEGTGCAVLESERAARGMGASLAALIEHTRSADGWIVALGDMPLVSPATIAAVRAALEAGARVAAPTALAGGRHGHPVGFAAALGDELAALDGDAGARAIVERHSLGLVTVPTGDAGIFVDLDTPEALAALGI